MTVARLEITVEELSIAWSRVKADHLNVRFVDHPHVLRWIESDLDAWLVEIRDELAAGYQPRSSHMCWALKPGGLLRPGTVLEVEDELVYNMLLGRLLPQLRRQLADLQGNPDLSYILADSADDTAWIRTGFRLWTQWRKRSIERLDQGASYMLVADITGFYDNIDIRKLMSHMRAACGARDELKLLGNCLSKWARPRDRGIPQGYSASHLLAKLFLEPVDRALMNDGYVHLRYVDDYRVFLESKRQGRAAIARLTALLHRTGLSLQSAKTKVMGKSQAKATIDGVALVIGDIADTLAAEIGEAQGLGDDYLPSWEVDEILESREGPPPEILERAFQEHFAAAGDDRFNKTVFRYLLTRLGKARSNVAVEYCLDAIRTRPEETAPILRYFAGVHLSDAQSTALVAFMGSPDAQYDYQLYQFVRWLYVENLQSDPAAALCRDWAFDQNRSTWLRSYCVAYLGEHGDASDLDNLEESLSEAHTAVEKADIISAIRKMEVSRRNATYGRAEAEDGLAARAVRFCKSAT